MNNRKLLNIELHRVSPEEYASLPESGVVVVLDNIRSAHNVGSAFRSSDSFKVDKLWLCGICATPPSAEIRKAALGAEETVPWEYSASTLETVGKLKAEGYTVVSVEQTVDSKSLEDFYPEDWDKDRGDARKYAFVFGNEVDGVSQEVVDASDFALEIPQFGTKHSLNVSVAIGVVLWHITEKRLNFRARKGTRRSGRGLR
ncbi:MAG: RNA methyltransferase [Bacteroidales bacterium]|nr:RNA methyltransferase [Bacteroidales bacterium]